MKRSLGSWIVDEAVMARTNKAIFMHPLPVRRNVVATDDVLERLRQPLGRRPELEALLFG